MMLDREIVVVGGGPGGLRAALAAARCGAQVTLLDGYTQLGGQYYRQPPARLVHHSTHHQRSGQALVRAVLQAGVEVFSETLVWNCSRERVLAFAGPPGSGQLRAKMVILSSGAYERVVPFPGWTLPGVMTSGAAQSLLYQGVLPGKRALVAGTGPLQLTTAADLANAGVQVSAVLEGSRLLPRSAVHLTALWGQWERAREGAAALAALIRHNVPYRPGWGIIAVHGSGLVEGATIARLDGEWNPMPGTERQVDCDTICLGWGLIPFNALSCLAGAAQSWQPKLGGEVPLRDAQMQTSVAGIYAVGDGAGIGGYRLAELEGQVAGLSAAASLGYADENLHANLRRLTLLLRQERRFQELYAGLFTPGPGVYHLAREDTPICRCEGVTLDELRQAVAAGACTTAEVKAVTRCGMGECQGRTCGQAAAQITARLVGVPVEQAGLLSPRPPLFTLPLEMLVKEPQ